MTNVKMQKDGTLKCLDCGERVYNTANNEMRGEGYIAYSHSCKEKEI